MHRHPFQSTPPGWEATTRTKVKPISAEISIHASRVGGDQRDADRRAEDINFNPRLPGGRRPAEIYRRLVARGFQSTPPGWEATVAIDLRLVHRKQFQSTPPGWEATVLRTRLQSPPCNFNPRLPGGRRPAALAISSNVMFISIHASRVGGDSAAPAADRRASDFNPRLPSGRRRYFFVQNFFKKSISIHASRVGGDDPYQG